MSALSLVVTSVSLATPRPAELAAFYSALLDLPVGTVEEPGPDGHGGWAQIGPRPGQASPTLNFEYERHFVPPVWPAEAGRPLATQHLDIHVQDLSAAVEHAVRCGARLADYQPQDHVRVLLDPHGHPFCLFT